MSNLSDFLSSAGGGSGNLPWEEVGTTTGTVNLDYSAKSGYKIVQGNGDLTLNFDNNSTTYAEGKLGLQANPDHSVTVNNAKVAGGITGLASPFDVQYANQAFSFGSEVSNPVDLAVSSDEEKLFIMDSDNNTVLRYSLPLPNQLYDRTVYPTKTPLYDNKAFDFSEKETQPTSLNFSSDGKKMYVTGFSSRSIHQYNLGVAWDVTTAVFSSSFDFSSKDIFPKHVVFADNGLSVEILGRASNSIYKYELLSAWQLSTINPSSESVEDISSISTTLESFFYVSGLRVYLDSLNIIYERTINDNSYMVSKVRSGFSLSESSKSTSVNVPLNIWSLTNASYTGTSFIVVAEDAIPYGIAFSTDGTKMYMVGGQNDSVYEYSLSTPWSLASASYTGTSLDISEHNEIPYGIAFSTDGTKMYMIGTMYDSVYEYSLSTPWSLASAAYTGTRFIMKELVGGTSTQVVGIAFSTGGSKMYSFSSSNDNDAVYEYSLTNIKDDIWSLDVPISEAFYTGKSFSVNSQNSAPEGIAFSTDGTKMYIVGYNPDDVYEYSLSTPWSLDSAAYTGTSFSVIEQATFPQGIAFSTDGTKMYISDGDNDNVYEYSLSTPWSLASASYTGTSLDISEQDTTPSGIAFSTDGTKMYIVGYNPDDVYEYSLSTPWSLASASYTGTSLDISEQDPFPQGIAFSTDGTKMYMVGFGNDSVYEYSLSTPWSLASADYTGTNFSLTAQTTVPQGIAFSTDGTEMYIIESSTKGVYQYLVRIYDNTYELTAYETSVIENVLVSGSRLHALDSDGNKINECILGTPWQISSATCSGTSFDTQSQDTTPVDFVFGDSGNALYVLGQQNKQVYQYSLSVPYSVSSASYTGTSGSLQGSTFASLQGLLFSETGNKLFVLDNAASQIFEYDLSTPWNITSISYSGIATYAISSLQDSSPVDIAFTDNGSTLAVLGASTRAIYYYVLSTPYDITTAAYKNSYSIADKVDIPVSISYTDEDNTKMYIHDAATKATYQYQVDQYTNQMVLYDVFQYGSDILITTSGNQDVYKV